MADRNETVSIGAEDVGTLRLGAPPTRADRLHAIIAKVAPKAAAYYARDRQWPPNTDLNGKTEAVAPYVITTTPDGGRRLRVIGDDGDVIGGTGATLEDALAAVEQKIGGAHG